MLRAADMYCLRQKPALFGNILLRKDKDYDTFPLYSLKTDPGAILGCIKNIPLSKNRGKNEKGFHLQNLNLITK